MWNFLKYWIWKQWNSNQDTKCCHCKVVFLSCPTFTELIFFSHVFLMRPKSVKIAYWVSLTWWPLTCDWWSVTTLAVLKSGKVGLITNEQNSAQFWPQVNGNFRWQPQSIIGSVVFVKTITIATSIFYAGIQRKTFYPTFWRALIIWIN